MLEFGNLRKKMIPVLSSEELESKHFSHHHSVQKPSLSLFRVNKPQGRGKNLLFNPLEIWTANVSKHKEI